MGQGDQTRTARARVLIVDDHPIVRKGLSQLINQEFGFDVVGEAEDGQGALKLVATSKPDIVILDLSLPDMKGLDLLKIFKSKYPKLLVLVLSMHDESVYAERVLRAGAKGYIMKQEGNQNLIAAIRKVLAGGVFVSEDISSTLLSRMAGGTDESKRSPLDLLSDRELEVFQMIGAGMGTRQIAEKLVISIKTVESYREHIKFKLKLKNSVELVRRALQLFPSNPDKI